MTVDAILTVVCQLSKYMWFLPTRKEADAVETAKLFYDEVVYEHGHPKSIVSDRDSRFLFAFSKTLHFLADTKLLFSTSTYPQTDGQTERDNRTIDQMLPNRCFVVDHQEEWVEHLKEMQFAYRTSVHPLLGRAPYQVACGDSHRQPQTFPALLNPHHASKQASDTWKDRTTILQEVKDRLNQARERAARFANLKRREEIFKKGDWVLVHWKFFQGEKLPGGEKRKLAAVFYGPFEIECRVGEVAYELVFLEGIRRHPVLHVSFLKRYEFKEGEQSPPSVRLLGFEEREYEMEKVIDKRRERRQVYYLVHWIGDTEENVSWEPAANLKRAQATIQDFKKKQARK
uniref:Integrase catalytic domain-containing protein n=1 Tax=Chromera velia CCMP2878 TaxID=1169474 RepID=A0A0G4HUK8_9ALVE|eukprot:Cvel_31837.t1-p1 / transcript=Cvel_31837.t1 / gene=Cvel_31837 / organism=Chromera_velia_CCMP2878 / gene_product=Retrotransposable element Tf2 155 kDa protein type, putative / transcript_product=Retrotransposable element Tf2 155 kDa protein type, putative / location=Cvel_scaffold4815:4521-5549(+) / protein_length=343 / sequence_SO=supercontig / SO=protein_coding / is_pseudo=false